MPLFTNKMLMITGGTGLKYFIKSDIGIFSRDEIEWDDMRRKLLNTDYGRTALAVWENH